MTRINFAPYTAAQLVEIVQARLATAKESLEDELSKVDVMAVDAITLAAKRISNISGDARRVLDVCRYDRTQRFSHTTEALADRRAVERVSAKRTTVKMGDVSSVISAMQSSPTAAYLRDCSLHERIMLAALIRCIKREGVEEIKWADVRQSYPYLQSDSTDSNPGALPTP